MKKLNFFLPVFICFLLMAVSCNNASKETNTTKVDSTTTKDTIKSDPSKFSEPH